MIEEILGHFIGTGGAIFIAIAGYFINRRIIKNRNARALLLEIKIIEERFSLDKPEVVGEIYDGTKIQYSPSIVDISNFESLVSAGNLSFYNDDIRARITKFYKTVIAHNELTKKLGDIQRDLMLNDKEHTYYEKVAVPLEMVLTQFEEKIASLIPDTKADIEKETSFF